MLKPKCLNIIVLAQAEGLKPCRLRRGYNFHVLVRIKYHRSPTAPVRRYTSPESGIPRGLASADVYVCSCIHDIAGFRHSARTRFRRCVRVLYSCIHVYIAGHRHFARPRTVRLPGLGISR